MIAASMAPGMNRSFLAEAWTNLIPRSLWYEAADEAASMVDDSVSVDIQGYDADGDVIRAARENAERAGVALCPFRASGGPCAAFLGKGI